MAQQRKRNRGKKRKGKIKFKQTARLVEKNDATRVARADTTSYKNPPTNVADFLFISGLAPIGTALT